MKEIKCPNCGQVITVDDADFAAILNQVRTEEFDAEVRRRVEETTKLLKAQDAEKAALKAAAAAKEAAQIDARHKEDLSRKDVEIEKLKQQGTDKKSEEWDELEHSILANLADDVIVKKVNSDVELVIIKKVSPVEYQFT